MKYFYFILLIILTSNVACGRNEAPGRDTSEPHLSGSEAGRGPDIRPAADDSPAAQQTEPRSVRDFFMASTQDVFYLEGCEEGTDPGCRQAKERYLKDYLEVEDTKNGYLSAGGDGAQAALTMTLFKRPSGKYIVAVNQFGEIGDDYRFFEFEGGTWKDISARMIPEYSTGNIYELPRFGTTIKVFAKNIIDSDGVVEMSDKGKKLYDLIWKDGKFSINRN